MWQPQQMMLKNLVDDMDVVEDPQEDRRVLGIQPFEIPGDNIVEAAIGPLFVAYELRIGLRSHQNCLSAIDSGVATRGNASWNTHQEYATNHFYSVFAFRAHSRPDAKWM
jgi:hypothetical protein